MTTVVCVWVQGHVPFVPDYVRRLRSMVAKWMDRPYRFVCLTDQPWTFTELAIETVPIPPPFKLKGWWSKVRLFDPAIALTGKVLYLDLDTLLVGPLGPILDYPARFALAPHAGHFQPQNGLAVVRRFNSSVMTWHAGEQTALWSNWTPEVAARRWGDQDWIGEQAPASTVALPAAWFPRLSEAQPPWSKMAKVVLCKKPKNVEAAVKWPWFREAWQ